MKDTADQQMCIRDRYYTIPFGSSDGKNGEWKKGPGRKLVDVILKAAGDTKVIAEDLGVSVPAVSYTHLDVYKRQDPEFLLRCVH